MKRFIAIMLTLFMMMVMISGCAQTDKPKTEKISIVCTIFPQYDWVRQIFGDKADNVELTLLLNNKIDLHSFQPTVNDIIKISACDLFVYVGGESDGWVTDALKEAANPNMRVINLLETLGDEAKEEEIIAGMEDNYEYDEEDNHKDEPIERESEEEMEYDEHVWLSLKNAKVLCSAIADALSSLDAENAENYQANLSKYLNKLALLHEQYTKWIAISPVKTLLFGDRFPFRYLIDDYRLDYHAAFPGCSAETEASFDTIIFLAKKVDKLNLKTVMVTESSDKKIAETIISNTAEKNQQILVLDAMQSVTSNDVQSGTTYLSIMESNLNVLKDALK